TSSTILTTTTIFTTTTSSSTSTTTASSSTTSTTAPPKPPIANAGPDQFTQTMAPVGFNGGGSFDLDGTLIAYAWDFGDGTSAAGATVSHGYAAPGSYTATLTVTDDRGARGTDSALVTVTGSAGSRWAHGFGGTASDVGYGVAVDASGNAVMTGRVESTVDSGGNVVLIGTAGGGSDFGGGPIMANGYSVVVAKFSPTGAHLWSKGIGDSFSNSGNAVAVDAGGNIAVTGAFSGPADFGGGVLTSAGVDVFLAKLSPTGGHLWSRHFGSALAVHAGNGVACDGSGNVLVTGSFENSIDLGAGWATSFAHKDMFVAKYSAAGDYLWSRLAGGLFDDAGRGIAVDSSGKVVVTGTFQAAVNFGAGSLTSAGRTDIFVARYAADGTPLGAQRFG